MINLISYIVPFFGLAICLFVMFTKRIDTKCPIRISKICLWVLVWTIVLFYDYPYDALKALSIMLVRVFLLTLNILYIAEAILYRPCRTINRKKIN